jgi:D-proline reductase (dithiol) PrdB
VIRTRIHDQVGDLSEFSFPVRTFLKTYRWRRIDPVPWQPLRKPLGECRIAIVSTAGMVAPGQLPFDDRVRGGDWSLREIPDSIDVRTLIETHRSESFDHRPLGVDPNVAFPLDRIRELVAERVVGSANHRHLSFMGSLTATRSLTSTSALQAARTLAADGVDVALLVPV